MSAPALQQQDREALAQATQDSYWDYFHSELAAHIGAIRTAPRGQIGIRRLRFHQWMTRQLIKGMSA